MSKVTLSDLTNLSNEQSVVATINANNAALETALEKTLSRDGTTPNIMSADLDMNSNQILNLPDATTDQEPVTLGQFNDALDALEEGAVIEATFVTLSNNDVLDNERVLTAGTGVTITDGGAGSTVTVAADQTTLNAATATLTNKTINLANNTITGTTAEFNTALSDNNFATLAGSETLTNKTLTSPAITTPTGLVKGDVGLGNVDNTSDATKNAASVTLTNKTIALGSNTVSGTTAQFNTALSDNDFATLAGSETLTNKTLTSPTISTISNTGTITLPTSTDTLVGKATTDTLTNKTVNLTSNTFTGTTAQFNTALSDNDFATLAGSETLTNKSLTSPTVTGTMAAAAANFSGTITFGTGTITGLTNKASPNSTDDYVIIYDNAGTAVKKAPVGAVGSAGAVASIDGTTGAFTISAPLTRSSQNLTVATTSTSAVGAVELATDAETRTGTDTARAITPANHVASHRPQFEATGSATTLTVDTWQKLTIGSETLDTDACYDAATNYRFTPNVAGYYMITANGNMVTDGGGHGMAIYKNGAEYAMQFIEAGSTHTPRFSLAAVIAFNGSTDYVEVYGYSSFNAGPSVTCNHFHGFRIGPLS